MEWDRYLAAISRRAYRIPGFWRLAERLRQSYARKYVGAAAWTVIDDFDENLYFWLNRSEVIGSLIYWTGMHSDNELRLLGSHLSEDSVFIDVGANSGVFTVFAAKRVPLGRVVAFEPLTTNYAALVRNVELNRFSNVSTYRLALSDKAGEATIFRADEVDDRRRWQAVNSGTASLVRSDDRASPEATVVVSTLDAISETLPRVDVIKVDVEGSELPVLRGAEATLQRYHPVLIVEVCEWNFRDAGYSKQDLLRFLERSGYRSWIIGPRSVLSETLSASLPDYCNIICLARS